MFDYTIRDAAYVVEATRFETRCLHERCDQLKQATWRQVLSGYAHQVGKVGKMPVMVSVMYVHINEALVAFYEPISAVVDHRMVEDWLKAESPAYANGRQCDASRFHECLAFIKHAG